MKTSAPMPGVTDSRPSSSSAAATVVAQWRARIDSDTARQIYMDRAATAECVNALARKCGLLRMPVPGLAKVKCGVRLCVLAHNRMRMAALAPQFIGWRNDACAMAAKTA